MNKITAAFILVIAFLSQGCGSVGSVKKIDRADTERQAGRVGGASMSDLVVLSGLGGVQGAERLIPTDLLSKQLAILWGLRVEQGKRFDPATLSDGLLTSIPITFAESYRRLAISLCQAVHLSDFTLEDRKVTHLYPPYTEDVSEFYNLIDDSLFRLHDTDVELCPFSLGQDRFLFVNLTHGLDGQRQSGQARFMTGQDMGPDLIKLLVRLEDNQVVAMFAGTSF